MPESVTALNPRSNVAHKPNAVSWFVLCGGIAAISTASVLIRLTKAPSLVIGAYRMLIAALILAPLAIPRSISVWRLMTRRELLVLLLSGLMLALHFASWISSLSLTTVSSSVILVTTNPIFVGLASHFVLHEKISKHKILAIGLALIGTIIVAIGDFQFSGKALVGDLLALLGAMAISCHLLLGRILRRRLSTLAYVWPCYSTAGIVLLILCFISGQPLTGYSSPTFLYLLLLALVPQVIGHSAFNWALAYFSPILVSLAILGEPVGASILAYIILNEVPTAATLVGAAFTMAGIVFASLDER